MASKRKNESLKDKRKGKVIVGDSGEIMEGSGDGTCKTCGEPVAPGQSEVCASHIRAK